jgi:endonuclease III
VVLLFRFGRPVFPVDTNILRVARKVGWVSENAGPEEVRLLIERILPQDPRLLPVPVRAGGRSPGGRWPV